MQVFISYAYQDANLAKDLAWVLRERGFDPWLDQELSWSAYRAAEVLPAESSFPDVVEQAIANAGGFVFVIGAGAGATKRQQKEWHSTLRAHWGAEDRKALVPVLAGNAEPPPFLRGHVAVRVPAGLTDYSSQAEAVADQIARLLTHPAETIDPKSLERAKVEQEAWLRSLDKYIEALRAEQQSVG